jgi:hypothetical protein
MDRFSTLRKLRTSVFGPPKTAGDSFAETRNEIVKYKKVISAFEKTAERFEKEIHGMHDVHEKLSNELKTFEFRDSEQVRRFSDALDKMTAELTRFEAAGLRRKIAEQANKLTYLTNLLAKRDAALAEKTHFDNKVAKLTDEKKRERNDVKHETAIRNFAELDQKLELDSRSVLEQREKIIQELVVDYMQAYQRLFRNLQDAFGKTAPVGTFNTRGRSLPSPTAPPALEDTFHY